LTAPRTAASLSAIAGTSGGRAIPAKPKTKRTAKVSAKAKRETIAETFGNVLVGSEIIDFYYSRASPCDDGMKIFKEVAGRLLDSVTISVENRADGRHVRRGDRPAVAA
jgi:hypothetical protein